MEIFIAKQPLQVSRFKAWLLRKLDVHYELSEEALNIIDAINNDPTIPNVDQLKSEEVVPTTIEPVVDHADIGPLMLWDAARELPNRVKNTIIVVTQFKKLSLTRTTLNEFTKKVTELDLLKVPGCGSKTLERIREWLAEYELELRKDDTI